MPKQPDTELAEVAAAGISLSPEMSGEPQHRDILPDHEV